MIVPYTLLLPGRTHFIPGVVFSGPLEDDAERVDAFLEQALNLPPDARRAFLDRIGEEEPALRRILDTLLEGIDEAVPPDFLKPLPNTRSIINRIHRDIQDGPLPPEV